ncbi:MAG: hypothetical protein K2M06_06000 [Muribaculaceae bacterium]|nr:hypothetical protein [Muribaculaceae bacterium]
MAFRKPRIAPSSAILAITALAFAVMFIFTPLSTDDFWYMTRSMDKWFAGRPLGFPLNDILDEISWRYFNDNARLSNVIFAFLVYLPHWLVAAASAAMCAWALFSLARLSGVGGRDWKGAVWLSALFAMLLPWAEHLFTLCYSLNYVWPMALSAWIALRVLSGRPIPLWLSPLIGLLFGAWHEGFSVPVFVGIFVLALCRRHRFSAPWIWALLAGMALGILWLLNSPAFFSRQPAVSGSLFSLSVWAKILIGDILYLLFCLLAFIAACGYSTRGILSSPLILFVGAVGLVSLLIHFFAPYGLRVGLCAEVFAIPGIIILWQRCFSFPERLTVPASIFLGLFLFAHLLVASVCTIRLNRQYTRIYEQYRTSPDGHVFVDFTPDFEAPVLALGKPLFLHMESCIAVHLTGENVRKPLLAVPSQLAHIDSLAGSPAYGRPGLRGLDGRFFIPADSLAFPRDCWTKFRGGVLFGDTSAQRSLVAVPFVSEGDSLPYFYIFIEDRMPLARFKPVRGIYW